MALTLTIHGARILRPDGFSTDPLHVADGAIVEEAPGRKVDLTGRWVLPAMVDIHGDGFERHLAPRRGVMKDLRQGLYSADSELAANGITTAVFAQFYSWEGGMRSPAFTEKFLESLSGVKAQLASDIKVQLRFETTMLDDYPQIITLCDTFGIGYVVFNDHIPHDALSKGKRPPRLTGQALKSGRSPDAHLALLQQLHSNRDAVPEALHSLAAQLMQRDVQLGSHDDRTADARLWHHNIGARISEFPETREAAAQARALGDHIVLGAPNVVRGGSHSGNVAASDLIADGLCDALASDYHYPALRQAAFSLVDGGVCAFPAAWHLVSAGPAALLGLKDRGTLAPGKRADFIVLDPDTRRIEATIAAGKINYLSGVAAQQFISCDSP